MIKKINKVNAVKKICYKITLIDYNHKNVNPLLTEDFIRMPKNIHDANTFLSFIYTVQCFFYVIF